MVFRGHILNEDLFYFCFHVLIQIILENIICSMHSCLYVKIAEIQRSIWLIAAILNYINTGHCRPFAPLSFQILPITWS